MEKIVSLEQNWKIPKKNVSIEQLQKELDKLGDENDWYNKRSKLCLIA